LRRRRDSVASIETRLRAGWSGVRITADVRDFLYAKFSTQLVSPPNLRFSGYGDSASEAKRLGRDVGYSPPSSAEVKNEWSYTSTPPMQFPGVGRNTVTFFITGNYAHK
jgi:hypothetical protein